MYSYTYIFVSTVTVIAAVSIVIMAFVACGSGEEEPTAPQRYVVIWPVYDTPSHTSEYEVLIKIHVFLVSLCAGYPSVIHGLCFCSIGLSVFFFH